MKDNLSGKWKIGKSEDDKMDCLLGHCDCHLEHTDHNPETTFLVVRKGAKITGFRKDGSARAIEIAEKDMVFERQSSRGYRSDHDQKFASFNLESGDVIFIDASHVIERTDLEQEQWWSAVGRYEEEDALILADSSCQLGWRGDVNVV